MDSFSIISLNCRGLGNSEKRNDVLDYLKAKRFQICCLQDTHFVVEEEAAIKRFWGDNCFFSHRASNARGVAILFGEGVQYHVRQVERSNQGNFVALDLQIYDYDISLVSLYGPNQDNADFYADVERIALEFDNPLTILCGDWNLVQDFDKDTHNYIRLNNPNAKRKVDQLKNDLNLVDPWRELHAHEKMFTWRQPTPFKAARLDYFLVSTELLSLVNKTEILPGYRSDHSLVKLSLNLNHCRVGPSYWKFNNSLLRDDSYVEQIQDVIKQTIKTYSVQHDNNSSRSEVEGKEILYEFTVSDQLFFDTLLTIIRGETILYATRKKKNMVNLECDLEKEIVNLEKALISKADKDRELGTLNEKKAQLESLRKEKMEGIKMRSKIKWMEYGEKPSKYFLNLEKKNAVNKRICKLITTENKEIISHDDITSEIVSFYSKLYEKNPVVDVDLNTILNDVGINKLTNSLSQKLEGELSIDEVHQALKNMKNNKSPGLDGFTVEFFKYFWKELHIFLVRYLNSAYLSGMPYTQKLGVISLIPKGNQDRHYLKNWRPISLLNVVYKLGSTCIANRLKTVLPFLIHENQKGFMSGRFIGENIRLLYDILLYTDLNEIPGLLLLIDFEKAFDSISHDFIRNVLHFFKFGPSIVKWFNVFYENAQSCVLINGHLSPRFSVERGCRQGDPLSPYIFLLCAEILGLLFRQSNSIVGLSLPTDRHLKIIQYADDTLLTLNGSVRELNSALNILDKFNTMSGLKVNTHKTHAIWIGGYKNKKDGVLLDKNLNWVFNDYFRYLGIDFCTDLHKITIRNYNEKFKEIKCQMTSWLKRYLTVLGRVTVVKSLLVSKLNYLILSLPNPGENLLKDINAKFYNFIWGEKPDKISRNQMSQSYSDGGVRMIDINIHCQSLKISWIKKLVNGSIDSNILCLLQSFLPGLQDLKLYMGNSYFRKLASKTENPFWKETFMAYSTLLSIHYDTISCQPLWNNDYIKIGNSSIYNKTLCKKGVRFVNDILESNGNFLSLEDLQEKYNIQINFLFYRGLCDAIREGYKCTSFNRVQQPLFPDTMALVMKRIKGCAHIYAILLRKRKVESKSFLKWKCIFDLNDKNWETYCSIAFNCTMDVGLRWFQFKVLQRILYTNDLLFKMNLVPRKECAFCNEQSETVIHLLCDCTHVKHIWDRLEHWIYTGTGNRIIFSQQDKLFGLRGSNNYALDCMLIVVRQMIYTYKIKKQLPVFDNIKVSLMNYYKHEKYIADSNCRKDKFARKWFQFRDLFT